MTDEGITVVIDNGELIDIGTDCLQTLKDIRDDYLEYQRELIKTQNSISLSILIFVGACLGALIFRHLRK